MATYTKQHTYALKFTIGQTYDPPDDVKGKAMDVREDLDTVVGPDSATRDDLVKALTEKRIKQIIPAIMGAISIKFDSLVEAE
jgi:hypothetical protein